MSEKRILPPFTEEEYKQVTGIINGAIVMMDIHGCWNQKKNDPIMEKHFPGWEKLECVSPNVEHICERCQNYGKCNFEAAPFTAFIITECPEYLPEVK